MTEFAPLLHDILDQINSRFGEKKITAIHTMCDNGLKADGIVHGVTFRCLTESHGKLIVDWINNNWVYDKSRPAIKCGSLHRNGSDDYHINLQVHNRTEEVKFGT